MAADADHGNNVYGIAAAKSQGMRPGAEYHAVGHQHVARKTRTSEVLKDLAGDWIDARRIESGLRMSCYSSTFGSP